MPIIVKDRHFFGHKAIMSAVKKVEFVNDRMPYCACKLEDKCDNTKDRFYEELECLSLIISQKLHEKCCKEISMQMCDKKIFSARQFGMRVYVILVMIMELE
jgi:hypothetical protein